MTKTTRAYLAAVIGAGVATLAYALTHWQTADPGRLAVFVGLFLASATLKCRVPGVTGTYSPVFFFVLVGSTLLSFSEVVVAAALAGALQSAYKAKSGPSAIKMAFNAACLAVSSATAYYFVGGSAGMEQGGLLGMIVGAAMFYLVNTGLVAAVVVLVTNGSLSAIWKHWCVGSLAYYALGVLIVSSRYPAVYAINLVLIPAILLWMAYTRCWRTTSQLATEASRA